jgi:predicted NBD/HSP70 family sugar kinase
LNPKAGQFVGVDFEARQISATAVDFSQQTLTRHKESIRAGETPSRVLRRIKNAICQVCDPNSNLVGIGIGVPGSVDAKRGIAIHYEYIRDWHNVPLVEQIKDEFEVPVYLENNTRAMALAERWFGRAKDVDNFICLGIRSGIGAGVVINGQLYRGQNNLAGEIGSWRCPLDERNDGLGRTLEEQASVRAILEQVSSAVAREKMSDISSQQPLMFDLLQQAARSGDPVVLEVLRNAGHTIGWAVHQFNLLLNPEQIIVAGPLAMLGGAFLNPIREADNRISGLKGRRDQISGR